MLTIILLPITNKKNLINSATICHSHGLTVTITKQYGGTLVNFDWDLINLEYKQCRCVIHVGFDIFLLPFYDNFWCILGANDGSI